LKVAAAARHRATQTRYFAIGFVAIICLILVGTLRLVG
jgi:hypothetical protein